MSASLSDTEFTALWARPELSSLEIAAQLGITQRGANKRAQELNLPPKGLKAGRLQRVSAQLLRTAGTADGAPGEPLPPWMADPDLRPLFDELWQGLREARTGQDIVRLRALQLRLHTMVALRYPMAVDLLQVLAESAKLVLAAQKVESELPPAHDPAVLRQQAARQMMMELGSVLGPTEQDELGRMLQVAADRLVAQRVREGRLVAVGSDVAGCASAAVPSQAPW